MVPGWKCYLASLINCYYLFISTDGVKQPKVVTKTKSCVPWLSTFKIQQKKKPLLFNTFKVTQLVWIFLGPHSFLVHDPFPSSFLKPVHIVELILNTWYLILSRISGHSFLSEGTNPFVYLLSNFSSSTLAI